MPSKNNAQVQDINTHGMEEEIILMSEEADKFEENWVKKREKNGAKIIKVGNHEEDLFPINPKILTKVGHGVYMEHTMTMYHFYNTSNHILIEKFKDILIHCPTIKRLNLYACKSGLPPIESDKKTLAERLSITGSKERFKYGQMSFAEYFILKLAESFSKEEKEFPQGLDLVACLGDVKSNNGKPGISGNYRKNLVQETYMDIDSKSKLIRINCNKFLAEYKLINSTKQENTSMTFYSNTSNQRNTFFVAQTLSESQSPQEDISYSYQNEHN
ncbi:Uncharacterised protein [Legionella busanensis]|uniref:Uncharacterized protein n=1 Tax=Legionella busanensis TaxID=190655 RepID=A0A378JLV6_9GAMM|nr:hypothetical protein [Legionella busanensis]STX51678.1 Uncharacterised protein [Legionella busanensis]